MKRVPPPLLAVAAALAQRALTGSTPAPGVVRVAATATLSVASMAVAGTTAAETLRKNDPTCQVTLLTDEPYPLYNRVALPPFLKHRTPREKVFMRTVEQHKERGIDLRLETRVDKIDTEVAQREHFDFGDGRLCARSPRGGDHGTRRRGQGWRLKRRHAGDQRQPTAIAMAPPEPPSPRITATFGTCKFRQASVERAMASA